MSIRFHFCSCLVCHVSFFWCHDPRLAIRGPPVGRGVWRDDEHPLAVQAIASLDHVNISGPDTVGSIYSPLAVKGCPLTTPTGGPGT